MRRLLFVAAFVGDVEPLHQIMRLLVMGAEVGIPEKRQAREKLFSEQFDAKAKNYLRELRRQAMIERK